VTIPLKRERLVMYRLVLGLCRNFHQHFGAKKRLRFSDLVIFCAVGIGHTEGRPMNASKLSHFLSFPRTSVLRSLKSLEDAGFVTVDRARNYLLRVDNLPDENVVMEIVKLIVNSGETLGKLHPTLSKTDNKGR
jgi:hypothetical protein